MLRVLYVDPERPQASRRSDIEAGDQARPPVALGVTTPSEGFPRSGTYRRTPEVRDGCWVYSRLP